MILAPILSKMRRPEGRRKAKMGEEGNSQLERNAPPAPGTFHGLHRCLAFRSSIDDVKPIGGVLGLNFAFCLCLFFFSAQMYNRRTAGFCAYQRYDDIDRTWVHFCTTRFRESPLSSSISVLIFVVTARNGHEDIIAPGRSDVSTSLRLILKNILVLVPSKTAIQKP